MLTAIGFVGRREHIEASAAVRKLIRVGLETYTVKLYQQGFLSLRETAKRLSLDLVETTELMLDYGVKGNLTASDVLQSIDHFC